MNEVEHDGRRLRRARNVDAVQTAILGMLDQWEQPTLTEVAGRSGVTVRSIYRYFEDLDDAVTAAKERRVEEILTWLGGLEPIDPTADFDARVAEIVRRRIEVERRGRCLQLAEPYAGVNETFDEEVRELFASEFAAMDETAAGSAAAAVGYVLRPRAIRGLVEVGSDEAVDPRMLEFAVRRLLLGDGLNGLDRRN